MNESSDLSGGKVPEGEKGLADLELQEEKQRLKWKTGVLCVGACTVVAFYLAGLIAALVLLSRQELNHNHVIMVGFVFVVPTLIAINFFKVVAKTDGMSPKDFDNHPIIKLIREVVETFKPGG